MSIFRARTPVVLVLTTIAVSALVLTRVVSEAREELAVAEAYHADGRMALAVEHYRRALRWSYPLSSSEDRAVSQLESIAAELEAEDDRAGALMAWRSLSGGLAATRFIYSAANPSREKANDQIARLVAMDRSAGMDAGVSEARVAAYHRRLLSEDVSPDPWWGSLLLAGMIVWLGALFVLARHGFDSAGRLLWSAARAPVCGAIIGFVSFALGLLFA